MFKINNISLQYGGLKALSDINLTLEQGEVRGLIGPNGAGKTTLLNCISGLSAPSSGQIYIDDREITRLKPDIINQLGISRTFQHAQVFGERNVLDHILTGMHREIDCSMISTLLSLPKARQLEEKARENAKKLVQQFDLQGVQNHPVVSLPYGLIKRVDLARAIATRPKLLLLDEPTSGMTVEEADLAIQIVKENAKKENITLLVIEHNMRLMMRIAEKITVLHLGCVICEGTPSEVQENTVAIDAYLGQQTDA